MVMTLPDCAPCGKGLLGRMTQHDSSPSDSPPQRGTEETTANLHERAARLREKVSDLAQTFERIEQNLAEASDEREDSAG